VAHFPFNLVGDSPYGYSIIHSIYKITENLLNMQSNAAILLDRKSNSPVHIKIGSDEYPAKPSDIEDFGNNLQNITARTEWVTNHVTDINVVGFEGKLLNLAPYAKHYTQQMLFGLEVPLVLMGEGNIPEGLARTQMEAFQLRIKSIQENVEHMIESLIFKRLLTLHGFGEDEEIEFEWGMESETEGEIGMLMDLIKTPLSPGAKLAIEQRMLNLLGIEAVDVEILPPQAKPGEEEPEQPTPEKQKEFMERFHNIMNNWEKLIEKQEGG